VQKDDRIALCYIDISHIRIKYGDTFSYEASSVEIAECVMIRDSSGLLRESRWRPAERLPSLTDSRHQ